MNHYEARRARRRQRLIERAARKDGEAAAAFAQSVKLIEGIPLSQPVLAGHHSEKRHRRDLARSDRAMRRSVEATREAEELRGCAVAVGTGGISSDDPDALIKLQAQLAELEARHARNGRDE